jgi:hypothetical protein
MNTPALAAVRSSDLETSGIDSRPLRRLAARGIMTRVVPGAFLDTASWNQLVPRDRYVIRIRERVRRLTKPVVISHWSAAAVWDFSVPDVWPDDVQVIDPMRATSNRIATLHRRPGSLSSDDVVPWEGLFVTSPARTAADLVLSSTFADSVMVLDHGLHHGAFTKAEVEERLDRRPEARRQRSARSALAFADAKAEWPGESYSRVAMSTRGLARPTLQETFVDRSGSMVVDFWWEAEGIAGEFDGDWKYTDPRFLRGRSAADVIRDEKRRQGRLESNPRVHRVVRWDYAVARDPDELARRLRAAGVPDRRRVTGS